jgi:hypothetical protein
MLLLPILPTLTVPTLIKFPNVERVNTLASTYAFVAASVVRVGVAKFVIF